MQANTAVERCRGLVTQLNTSRQWGLNVQDEDRYVQAITSYHPDFATLSEGQVLSIVGNYHADHALVEALIDVSHLEHAERWVEWTRLTSRILRSRAPEMHAGSESGIGLDDLIQEGLTDLWKGLPTFKYQSRFKTWAFTTISNCLNRHFRALNTKKRAYTQTQSLDAIVAVEDTLHDVEAIPPERIVINTMFMELWQAVLRQHPDRRLAKIFWLWAYEQQTLKIIGDQFHVGPSRVHTLLKQAINLLKDELTRQEWIDSENLSADQRGASLSSTSEER